VADSRDYEKLGAFYLGREVDPATKQPSGSAYLYDSRDLCTHAVILGMTGSGKTGLAISLLEEAAIDGIPVIAIDPKGDLGNLLLSFPELRAADFLPWIDAASAARAGRSRDQEAEAVALRWREGLAASGQSPERIARYAAAAERVIYTPGSRAGRTLSLVGAFGQPPEGAAQAAADNEEWLRERVQSSVSGLLALVGIDADPIQSREHILLTTLVLDAFRNGRAADLAALIREIQKPPLERVGVLDLETFYPARERAGLALALNNLLASPGFSAWLEGDPLDAAHLLFAAGGKSRLSILSIAHLSDAERMFAVTLILNQLVAWMRQQPGTGSLRALLYMDEVFGYFPPTANPPSKLPLLTLLKQARAFGVGVVLATQNPVDLDYKGLGNAGTWFLGRLQTERDQARVLDGLAGAAASATGGFDRAAMEQQLAGLGNRIFLAHNVHEDAPVLFQTRQALSYLAGPLTREQIRALSGAAAAPAAVPAAAPAAPAASAAAPTAAAASARPALPASLHERFAPALRAPGAGESLVYRPALYAAAQLHYVDAKSNVDVWRRAWLVAEIGADGADPWEQARELAAAPRLAETPESGSSYAPLPARATSESAQDLWRRQLGVALNRNALLALFRCADPKQVSRPGETEDEFRGRLAALAREGRDAAVEKLRARYAPKLATLLERAERADVAAEREATQARGQKLDAAVSIGASLVGALFGRKLGSASNVSRAARAARGISRAAQEHADIARAEDRARDAREAHAALEAELAAEIAALDAPSRAPAIERFTVSARKTDLVVEDFALLWLPHAVSPGGVGAAAFEL
jgi:hypothetical protein